VSFRTTLSDLEKYSMTRSARGLSATAELLVSVKCQKTYYRILTQRTERLFHNRLTSARVNYSVYESCIRYRTSTSNQFYVTGNAKNTRPSFTQHDLVQSLPYAVQPNAYSVHHRVSSSLSGILTGVLGHQFKRR